ncbi:uncharacterized protein LAESUDRAFT_669135 [Laetiporus sulphureus 93-53]|uniref:Golgi apparatus membrane protein TVP38 n=1 Tax=Laetiporus sulphureus 93-53 TaxID=1314785 RepID=A0A165IEM9_9APHY|nr:uncharacterized protein LAESUDRAFT_669135 [Laetiporus sulphureus 93-53]KZT12969.1 hypothetical protein LAESUDRAFT_669135 [Laetiporus sulphureus 93-53]
MDGPYSSQPRSGQSSRVLNLSSGSAQGLSSSPARLPHPPSRYVPLQVVVEKLDEKRPIDVVGAAQPACVECLSALPPVSSSTPSLTGYSSSSHHEQARPATSYDANAHPLAVSSWTAITPSYTRPRGLRIANLLRPWVPIILYALTSLGFLAAVSFWKIQVFGGLDALSHWLQSDVCLGYAVIFFLIFVTTFPPVPLYSTFVILSGYTFGPWTGAIISYWSSLAGALTVFVLSRAFFRGHITRWLACTTTIKRVVRAIEKRPKLLFLIRLAPYPYNVMNCLLAASPSLSLRTYTICTALSLFKLIIHTMIGSSIHSFAEYHVKPGAQQEEENMLGRYSTIAGIALCVAIFVYISYITRRAVNGELEDEDVLESASSEERVAFLGAQDSEDIEAQMVEVSGLRQPESR